MIDVDCVCDDVKALDNFAHFVAELHFFPPSRRRRRINTWDCLIWWIAYTTNTVRLIIMLIINIDAHHRYAFMYSRLKMYIWARSKFKISHIWTFCDWWIKARGSRASYKFRIFHLLEPRVINSLLFLFRALAPFLYADYLLMIICNRYFFYYHFSQILS